MIGLSSSSFKPTSEIIIIIIIWLFFFSAFHLFGDGIVAARSRAAVCLGPLVPIEETAGLQLVAASAFCTASASHSPRHHMTLFPCLLWQ